MKISIDGARVHIEKGKSITICFSQWRTYKRDYSHPKSGFCFGEIKISRGSLDDDPVIVEITEPEKLVKVVRFHAAMKSQPSGKKSERRNRGER